VLTIDVTETRVIEIGEENLARTTAGENSAGGAAQSIPEEQRKTVNYVNMSLSKGGSPNTAHDETSQMAIMDVTVTSTTELAEENLVSKTDGENFTGEVLKTISEERTKPVDPASIPLSGLESSKTVSDQKSQETMATEKQTLGQMFLAMFECTSCGRDDSGVQPKANAKPSNAPATSEKPKPSTAPAPKVISPMCCGKCGHILGEKPPGTWGSGWSCDNPSHTEQANKFNSNDRLWGCPSTRTCNYGVCLACWESNNPSQSNQAAKGGCEEFISLLLQKGFQIDSQCKNGRTPLMEAAHKGRLSACELFVKLGASVLLKNTKGQTALVLAKMAASFDVACFLVQSDNNLSDEDKKNETDILSKGCFCVIYVCKKDVFVSITRLMDFETAIQKGYIIPYPGQGNILFCSHRWLDGQGTSPHPDNKDNIKLNAVKTVLKDDCDLLDVEFIWIDFMCVPQHNPDDQLLAINSLPYIVQKCSHFMVLQGTSGVLDKQGKDEASLEVYRSRGWCRLECLSASVSPEMQRWILSINTPYTKNILEHLGSDLNPFQGRFFDRNDRRKIAPAVFSMHMGQCLEDRVGIKADAFRHLSLDAQRRHTDDCPSIPVHEITLFELYLENEGIEVSFKS